MDTPGSYRGIIKVFVSKPDEIQKYFVHLPKLITEYPLYITLAYLFANIERAKNDTLYCGVVKMQSADADLADKAINIQHMTRENYLELFENVFGRPMPNDAVKYLKDAEGVRDKVMHGKWVSDAEKRRAIISALNYAEKINAFVNSVAGFRPFGDLRGFKGRKISHDKSTTRWILKGLGFPLS